LKELGKPTELGTISVPGTASKIAISPDNRTIALLVDNDNQGSPIKKVLCWNFQEKTQPPVECFPRAFGMIEQIEFSPNGKYLALVEINEKAICEPKLPSLSGNLNLQSMNQSGEQSGVGELKIGQIHLLSMDGKSNDKDNISIVDKCGLDEAGENLFQNTPTISSIKFHPDSTYLAISVGKDVRFYDLKKNDFKESSTRIGHTESVNDLDFSIDGKYLATASDDNTSRILEFRSLFNNRRPTDTASDDNTIKAKVLRIFSKKKSAGGDQDKRNDSSILGHEDRVKRVTFGQGKANFFTIDSKGMISLWSVEGDITHPLVEFPIPSFYFDSPNDPAIVIASAKFSKSEGLFAFVGQGGRLFLWEIDPEAIEERICHGYQKNKAAEAQVDKFENSPYIAWDKRCNP
jgi:WD40 repeat protein